ncbi:MAG: hypothetical protein GF313_13670 [Caldithrix sp.]|nr:hypothetical protein [Caldithrix sp.]
MIMGTSKSMLLILMITIALFTLQACTGEMKTTHYYILTALPTDDAIDYAAIDSMQTLPYSIEISPFNIVRAYDTDRIAVRTNSNELKYYFYHKWAENPAGAIRFFVWKHIKESNLFKQAELTMVEEVPQFRVRGIIHHIERTDINNTAEARLSISLELIDLNSGTTVVKHSINRYAPINTTTGMNIFARNISELLAEETNRFLLKVYNRLKQ